MTFDLARDKMMLRLPSALILLFIPSLSIALPQGPAETTNTATPAVTGSPPSSTDHAPGGSGSSSNSGADSGSLVNYYFVFLALIICIAGLGAFLLYRRKRRMGAIIRHSRENALERDLNAWQPERAVGGRRRYWQGQWRSAEVSREEGLNEHGEAPPPYVPKPVGGEAAAGGGGLAAESIEHSPAVPLQSLSREQAGLKPPDYSENEINTYRTPAGQESAYEREQRWPRADT